MPQPFVETRWRAVLHRDASADGAFVYAVRSTGVYCRPICPSRRPRPEQVEFFDNPQQAERAGFRACLRCKPNQTDRTIERLCAFIEEHVEERLTLAALARRMGGSSFHLQRMFRRATGVTPRAYQEALRVKRLKRQLNDGADVTHALYDAGYSSSSRLYEAAPAQLGMTPGIYRRGAEGVSIRYTIAASPLGRLLLAATDHGVCSVKLGDSDAELEANLSAEFPRARISADDTGLQPYIEAVLAHLAGREPSLALPTDLRATAFQIRVWEELQRIPYGETRSYSEIAAALDQPKAARAVARACAANPVALVIPCHRVVRGNGDISGYRWGAERKRKLLAQEAANRSR
ncbi:MAG: bifunctional DNA-binding transcriptional regulator/O6-methylguanine-DNA methyltransferase Ada [Bryobacteraceae bacterium]